MAKLRPTVLHVNRIESMKKQKIDRQQKREVKNLTFPVNRLEEEHYSLPR